MSHKHSYLLEAIYHDPPSANIHWREIESLLAHVGATVESVHGARLAAGTAWSCLHHPHNSSTCPRQEIANCASSWRALVWTLSAYDAAQKPGSEDLSKNQARGEESGGEPVFSSLFSSSPFLSSTSSGAATWMSCPASS